MKVQLVPCPICATPSPFLGEKTGHLQAEPYRFHLCPGCRLRFISNPNRNFAEIYDLDYYSGRGVDPTVNYLAELEQPQTTVRQYEWRGVAATVRHIKGLSPQMRWLDYGCGNGGLVRWLREHHDVPAVGFEMGAMADLARAQGIPILTKPELVAQSTCYDVITAIEVLEHVEHPMEVLEEIYRLLDGSGVFFYTTGNAAQFQTDFFNWAYVMPDIHITYYEPGTLDLALRQTGFAIKKLPFQAGLTDIIRFKMLKALKVQSVNWWEKTLPWPVLARMVDLRYGISHMPFGWKRK
ncbi:MAG: class I SAM-dependent methyltransferase [Blastocatellia bacterium]|nr:class I SAM-dependent methyltransferase [Blastocatellia bacterium]